MTRLVWVLLACLSFVSLNASAQSIRRGSLAWRSILNLDEAESKEEIFDLLLAELFYSADFGFKAKDVSFSTAGVPLIGDQPIYMAQGEIIPTSSYLDFAIVGDGFFALEMPSGGYVFTRNGNFQLNTQGWVVNEEGFWLYPRLRIDRADVAQLRMDEQGRVLQVMKDGTVHDLYDFQLFLPTAMEADSTTQMHGSAFVFPQTSTVRDNFMIEQRSLELSTVKIERILARLSDLLFRIKHENPEGDYDFRFYMLDHLLKSQLQMGQTAQSIKRFSDLVKGVAPLLLFDETNNPSV